MAKVFRVHVDHNGIDDSFYFDSLPSREDVIKAIEVNKELAPEYNWFYDGIKKAAEQFDWPGCWSRGLGETGKGIWFNEANKLKKSPDVYIRIAKFNVIEVNHD